jgi:hypothetical protein
MSGSIPVSTSSRADIMPARPRPPPQWTTMFSPASRRARSRSLAAGHFASNSGPATLTSRIGNQAPTLDLAAQTRDGEPDQLLRLQQRDQRSGAPVDNHIEILGKVPGPGSAARGTIVLAGREGDADPPAAGADLYRGDLKGVGFAGSANGAPPELHDTRSGAPAVVVSGRRSSGRTKTFWRRDSRPDWFRACGR